MVAHLLHEEADPMTTTSPRTSSPHGASSDARGAIVVGVDGSPAADLAADWAATTARIEHRPLVLAHSSGLGSAVRAMLSVGEPAVDVDALSTATRTAGSEVLARALQRATELAPDVDVRQVLDEGDARQLLLDLATAAHCVVVGSRGRGGIASLLLGSVSLTVSTRAACPVVVVRHAPGTGHAGVLVDVDGTPDSTAAVEFAYRTASEHAWPLTVLSVVWDAARDHGDNRILDGDPTADDVRLTVAEALAGMREKYPDVDDEVLLVAGLRDQEILRASPGRALVVVGSRRRGAWDALLHGAVVSTVVEHAASNVAVVPSDTGRHPARTTTGS